MTTRDRLAFKASFYGWNVTDWLNAAVYTKGDLRINVQFTASGAILKANYGTACTPVTGRGRFDRVAELLARWSA